MALLGLDSLFAQTLFWTYVSLWVSCHLLIFQSRQPNSPAFNATSVVLLTEALKLLIALTLVLWNEGGFASLVRAVQGNRMLLMKYALPALLYCVYNNLVYVNLEVFDPGTYNVLLQLRIVLTGLLYQLLFSKQLNRHQWRAIILISVGCVVKESAKLSHGTDVMQADLRSWALLLAQMLCSVFAGVYNEMLLKGTGSGAVPVSTNLQNAYMYLNSVLWNGLFLLQQGKLNEALAPQNLSTVFTPSILAIMAIMSSVGMVTGFFLKHLDSVLKSIASAIEVVATTALSWACFGTPLDAQTLAAASLVGVGIALYARTPDRLPRNAALRDEEAALLKRDARYATQSEEV